MAISGDNLNADVGDSAKNIIVGKSNKQTVRESQQVNEVYFPDNHNAEMYRLITGIEARMTALESTYLTRSLIAEQQRMRNTDKIDALEKKLDRFLVQGPVWMQLVTLTVMTTLTMALIYFGREFYLLAHELMQMAK